MVFSLFVQMAKILVSVVMSAIIVWQTEAATSLEMRLGDGVHLEDSSGIVYENTVPLVYETSWKDLRAKEEQLTEIKWSVCDRNSTCMIEKILGDYANAVSKQLDSLEPRLFTTELKTKRSVMNGILRQCCGIATTDEFDELYRAEVGMGAHIQMMKNTIHENHRIISEMATSKETMMKDFNGILNETKHEITNLMLEEVQFQRREDIVVRHFLTVYKIINRLSIQIKKIAAANACQNKKLPASIVQPSILQTDLDKITAQLNTKDWELAITSKQIGKYYGLPIVSCTVTEERIIVRAKIPTRRSNRGWKIVDVYPIPIGDANSTCIPVIPSTRAVVSTTLKKFAWILEEKHCQPEINKLCLLPRSFQTIQLDKLSESLEKKCDKIITTHVTYLQKEKFAITNPPISFQIHCKAEKQIEFIKLPVVVHGYLEISLPCDCMAIIKEDLVIESLYPCDSSWTDNRTAVHVIPNSWIKIEEEEVFKVMNNETLNHTEKLNKLLKEDWEIKSKTIRISPEQEYQIPTAYNNIKKTAAEYHVEWTTIITLIILIIIFREPINLLLVRLVSPPNPPNREGMRIERHGGD